MSEEGSVRSLMDGENYKLTTSTHVSMAESGALQKHFISHGCCWNVKIGELLKLCSQYEVVQEREIALWFINVNYISRTTIPL